MNIGYGKSLGVSCTHCHIAGEWEKEDKTQKQTARDMSKMAATINNDLLKNIPNLKGPNAIVNCTTCHRGQVKPALNLTVAGTGIAGTGNGERKKPSGCLSVRENVPRPPSLDSRFPIPISASVYQHSHRHAAVRLLLDVRVQ